MSTLIRCDAHGCDTTEPIEDQFNLGSVLPKGWAELHMHISIAPSQPAPVGEQVLTSDIEFDDGRRATQKMTLPVGLPIFDHARDLTMNVRVAICPKHELPRVQAAVIARAQKQARIGIGLYPSPADPELAAAV